jgi:tetratricopeptide (TPR) repeat protein
VVRLVVLSAVSLLILLGGLSGCTPLPPKPEQQQATADDLPQWQDGMLASLSQGEHHPAVASLFAKAEQARQQQLWRKAMTYLDQARQIQPRNPAVFYRQAWVSLQMGDAVRAEQLLQRALVFAGGDMELTRRLRLLMAEALDAQGRGEEARRLRQQAALG